MAFIAAIIREDFAKAGILVNIKSLEWSVLGERVRERNFDACMSGFGAADIRGGYILTTWDLDPYAHYHSSEADIKAGANVAGFKDAEVDRILEEGRREFDLEKRTELYHELCRIFHAQGV